MTINDNLGQLALAIYTVNKHAKTALDNRLLYALKKQALEKLLAENRAKKEGLHFVNNPKFSQQQSSVLISCSDYFFHILPEKEDFKKLPHLGFLNDTYRNPNRKMSLSHAKSLLTRYIGDDLKHEKQQTVSTKKKTVERKQAFIHSSSYFYGH